MSTITLNFNHGSVFYDSTNAESGYDFEYSVRFGYRSDPTGTVTVLCTAAAYQSQDQNLVVSLDIPLTVGLNNPYLAVELKAWAEYGGAEGNSGWINSTNSPYNITAIGPCTASLSAGNEIGVGFSANRAVTGVRVSEGYLLRVPTADTAITGTWGYGGTGATSIWQAASAKGEGRYAYSDSNNGARLFTFSAFDVPTNSSDISVDALVSFGGEGSTATCTLTTQLYMAGTAYPNPPTSQISNTSAPTAYVDKRYPFAINPSNSQAWTAATVNGFTDVRIATPDAAPDVFIDYIAIYATYDPPAVSAGTGFMTTNTNYWG